MKFLGFKYFGILTKDPLMEKEAEMKYDAFFCFRFVNYFCLQLKLTGVVF